MIGEEIDSSGWVGRYSCPACGSSFATVGDKKRHLREEHGESSR